MGEKIKEKYKTKPRTILAHQWLGTDLDEAVAFVMPDLHELQVQYLEGRTPLKVLTPTGTLTAEVTDWLCCEEEKSRWFVLTNAQFEEEFGPQTEPHYE